MDKQETHFLTWRGRGGEKRGGGGKGEGEEERDGGGMRWKRGEREMVRERGRKEKGGGERRGRRGWEVMRKLECLPMHPLP